MNLCNFLCVHTNTEQEFAVLGVTESSKYLHPCHFFVCLVCVRACIRLRPICVVSAEQIWQVISRAEYYLYLSLSSPCFSSHSFIPIVFALSLWPHLSASLFTKSTCSCSRLLLLSTHALKIPSPLLGSAYTFTLLPMFTLFYLSNCTRAAHLLCGQVTPN